MSSPPVASFNVICCAGRGYAASTGSTPAVRRLTNVLCRPTSVVCGLTNPICRPTSVLCRLTSIVCRLTNAICRPASVVCKLASVDCSLTSIGCRLAIAVRKGATVLPRLWFIASETRFKSFQISNTVERQRRSVTPSTTRRGRETHQSHFSQEDPMAQFPRSEPEIAALALVVKEGLIVGRTRWPDVAARAPGSS